MTTPAAGLTLKRPDDWHLHLRDGPALAAVAGHTARVFGRAIVMPNLQPPVTTVAAAAAYRARILAALPGDTRFEPLMTLYLTDATPAADRPAADQHLSLAQTTLAASGAAGQRVREQLAKYLEVRPAVGRAAR